MLKLMPFFYGLKIFHVFESGSVFDPSILDISEDDLRARFMTGVANVACVSLAIGYPTVASVPHSVVSGFKVCCQIGECPLSLRTTHRVCVFRIF